MTIWLSQAPLHRRDIADASHVSNKRIKSFVFYGEGVAVQHTASLK